jgi:hypothetical protein
MNLYIRLAVMLFISLTLISCSDKGSGSSDKFSFEIDSSKINPVTKLSEFKIEFHAPVNWVEYSSELSDKVISPLSGSRYERGNFIFKPSHVFIDTKTNSVLSVGIVESTGDRSSEAKNYEDYIALLKLKYASESMEVNSSSKGEIKFSRIIIHMKNIVSEKFLLLDHSRKLIQFEYSTQQQNYTTLQPAIESSMGTLISSFK